jgi:AraC family transcriptional regulator
MNYYTSLINNILEYIEENIHEKLSLNDIGVHFGISKYHFNRMFRTVSGITLKQYISARKLTESVKYIYKNDASIMDAAMEFGFEYPEVFSRAFKKQFGVSPSKFSTKNIEYKMVDRIHLVDRNIINVKGKLSLKGRIEHLDDTMLQGISLDVDSSSPDFQPRLKAAGEKFITQVSVLNGLNNFKLYALVNCHEKDNGEYTVFYGMDLQADAAGFVKRAIPEGWYARFMYTGDMFQIRETFEDDLYRWIIINEIQLNPNGIGMINIFDEDYSSTSEVKILVPVIKP